MGIVAPSSILALVDVAELLAELLSTATSIGILQPTESSSATSS